MATLVPRIDGAGVLAVPLEPEDLRRLRHMARALGPTAADVVIPEGTSDDRLLEIWVLAVLRYGLVHYENLAHAVAARDGDGH